MKSKVLQVIENMERETRIELATNSLEGCDSTIELLPRSFALNILSRSRIEQGCFPIIARYGAKQQQDGLSRERENGSSLPSLPFRHPGRLLGAFRVLVASAVHRPLYRSFDHR